MYLLGSGMAQRRAIIRKHMAVLKFINSKDIREYLKKTDYKFNSLEAAWLIYQCRNATICEKHRAWNELIENMPDCRIEERFNTAPQESLHTFLKQYMELEDRYIKEFCDEKHTSKFTDNKPFVYQCSYIYQNGPEYDWNTAFSCLDTLYEATMEPEEDVIAVKCTKMQIDRLDTQSDQAHIKIWLDDIRKAPDGYYHCHSVNEAKKKIFACEKESVVIDEINCDHDLGDYAYDGGDGIKLLDWLIERNTYYPVILHTMNPVGRENMMREIGRYWKSNSKQESQADIQF